MTSEQIDTLNGQFHLSKEQWEKYFNWLDSLPDKYYGATSNGVNIIFEQCSIGIIVKAVREENESIDLTDWDSFG
jgi:hypothetical protein